MSLATPLLRVSSSICRGTLRRRPQPNPPPIHTAVVPELLGSLNGIDAGILPPRRATDASPRHPQKCRLYTVKANGLWPTPGIPPRQCTAGTRACLGSLLHVSAIIF